MTDPIQEAARLLQMMADRDPLASRVVLLGYTKPAISETISIAVSRSLTHRPSSTCVHIADHVERGLFLQDWMEAIIFCQWVGDHWIVGCQPCWAINPPTDLAPEEATGCPFCSTPMVVGGEQTFPRLRVQLNHIVLSSLVDQACYEMFFALAHQEA